MILGISSKDIGWPVYALAQSYTTKRNKVELLHYNMDIALYTWKEFGFPRGIPSSEFLVYSMIFSPDECKEIVNAFEDKR